MILVYVVFLFSSCKQNTIKTEEKNYINKYYLSKDTSKGALSVDLEIEFPIEYSNKEVLKSIQQSIITQLFGKEYVNKHKDSIVISFANELHKEYIDNNAPLLVHLDSGSVYSFNNEYSVEGFSLLSDEHIFTYGIDRIVYMGGAHSLETRNYYNFDLKTGKIITEDDLFLPNYKSALSEIIKLRIIEESDVINNMDELNESVFWTDSIVPNGNFYITDESLNYVFNPYEIAPFAYGDTEVNIPFSYLKKLLKDNSLINYLIKEESK